MECTHNNLFRIKDGRSHFWQWDTNQKLIINWAGAEQVHYSAPGDVALVTETYVEDGNIVSDVPNILLQNEGTLKVWVCDDDTTIHSQTTIVAARQRPADYVYTETDVRTWDELDERITELEENGGGGTGGQGKPGVTFIPNVSEEGIISWENDGGLDNPEPRDITGPAGKDGADGKPGDPGQDGKSAYQIALDNGFEGSEEEWLESLKGEPGEPGAKGDKGDKGDPGADGQPGKDGQDGQPGRDGTDGISPIVSVQDIDGGHRVIITDAEGEKTFDVMDGKDGKDGTGGGCGDCEAIIDVVELPTEDINEDVFYRLLTGTLYLNDNVMVGSTCLFVESLPQEGIPVTSDMLHIVLYYETNTESVSGYVDPALGSASGIPAGWYPIEILAPAFGPQWGGIIWDEADAIDDAKLRLLLTFVIWSHKKDWEQLKGIGWAGTGNSAELFNSPQNIASGEFAHAQGYRTEAAGAYSHAEGFLTKALNDSTHAEGTHSKALGYYSHAEGYSTIASSSSQHVQGKYNIEDTESKYAHIVGNGIGLDHRSNAHTLDWDGNAWYAGYVEGTALILPSPNGTRWRITVDDSGNLVTVVEG